MWSSAPHASVEFWDANFNFCPKVSEGRNTFQHVTTNFLLRCFGQRSALLIANSRVFVVMQLLYHAAVSSAA
jgi:hypothetical protein